VGREKDGEMRRVSVKYHMTEPVRITMRDRQDLVAGVKMLVGGIKETVPDAKICYLTMFPRHLENWSDAPGHITEEDVMLVNSFRKAVDVAVAEELEEMGGGGGGLRWWSGGNWWGGMRKDLWKLWKERGS
jgi:hypothetical protein